MRTSTLPRHSQTGEFALGFRKDGRPIWPIKGGSGEGEPPVPPVVPPVPPVVPPVVAPPADDKLGEGGIKALQAERDARKAADARVAELEAEANRLRRSNAASKGTDLEALKAEIQGEFAVTLAETNLKAEAKGRLVNPADVLLYVKAEDLKGKDDAAVAKAVDDLLKERPYLAAADSSGKWGDVGGGNRETSEPEPTSAFDRLRRGYENGSK